MMSNLLQSGDFLAGTEEIVAVTTVDTNNDEFDDEFDDDLDVEDDDDLDDLEDVDVTTEDDVLNLDIFADMNTPGDGVITQLFDIEKPLLHLRTALEKQLRIDLKHCHFWLQDSQQLQENTTLVDQCVQGEGIVQINVEIKGNRINIVDVLKPADDANVSNDISVDSDDNIEAATITENESPENAADGSVTKWVVCSNFRKEQTRLNIPMDPEKWSKSHVNHWIKWAVKEFPNASISLGDWHIDGRELCAMTHDDFKTKVPIDPNDLFWTHLELLRRSKFVTVVQKGKEKSTGDDIKEEKISDTPRKTNKKPPVRLGAAKFTVMSESALGNRTGNNGQVQLWQFLLELLTDKDHRAVIQWIGEDGEFKLENPEMVAQLWGTRKNKPNMNYEKLSRALRYYYDGDMISKVHGKRFVYKFVCDLKQLIGYTAAELNALVIEAENKTKTNHFRSS